MKVGVAVKISSPFSPSPIPSPLKGEGKRREVRKGNPSRERGEGKREKYKKQDLTPIN